MEPVDPDVLTRILTALPAELDTHDHRLALRSGASVKDLVLLHAKGLDTEYYTRCLVAGSTSEQICEAIDFGIPVDTYTYYIEAGSAPTEALETWSGCTGYATARLLASAGQVQDLLARDINLFDYYSARCAGAEHDTVLRAHAEGIDIYDLALSLL